MFPQNNRLSDFSGLIISQRDHTMKQETLAEKRDWLHNQLNGAIAFAVLTTLSVFMRCLGLGLLHWKKKILIRFSLWEDSLILASLIAFLPLCACAIGKISYCNTNTG